MAWQDTLRQNRHITVLAGHAVGAMCALELAGIFSLGIAGFQDYFKYVPVGLVILSAAAYWQIYMQPRARPPMQIPPGYQPPQQRASPLEDIRPPEMGY